VPSLRNYFVFKRSLLIVFYTVLHMTVGLEIGTGGVSEHRCLAYRDGRILLFPALLPKHSQGPQRRAKRRQDATNISRRHKMRWLGTGQSQRLHRDGSRPGTETNHDHHSLSLSLGAPKQTTSNQERRNGQMSGPTQAERKHP